MTVMSVRSSQVSMSNVYPTLLALPVARWFNRYGHTKIVKEFGAPPTAAQLGGGGAGASPMGGGYMAGPMPGPPPNGYAQQPQARAQYTMPPNQQMGGGQGFYGQAFGGDVGSGGMQQHQQATYHAPPQPPRPSSLSAPGAPSSGGVPLPTPGGYAQSRAGGGSAPKPQQQQQQQPRPPPPSFPPAADSFAGGGGGGGGYGGAFNPTTTVVAADSTSSAVL